MKRLDVDQMLEELSPEQFDEWMGFYLVEPFGEQWRQTALIAAESRNAGVIALAPHMKRRLGSKDFVSPDDYFGKSKPSSITPEQFEEIARITYGNHR
jgi:hypothetical protein